jgi:tetratricopeptide (TPR) repeat protein
MSINRVKILAAADKFIAQQKYDKALNELLKLVSTSPNDSALMNKIGDLYAQLGNAKSAIPYFEKVAESYRKGGFYPKTIALYKKIIRMDPSYLEGREKLVDLFIQQGLFSEAKGELKGMAQTYVDSNLPARAMSALEKIIQIEPGNIDARMKLTEILIREGRSDEATNHFLNMGRDLLDKNMASEARKMLSQAIKLDERNVGLQVLMARANMVEGKHEEAIKSLTQLCEANPRDVEAVRVLGQAYLAKQMLPEAKVCFQRALHIDASQTQALEEVARLLLQQGALDEAYDALVPVAEALQRKGDTEEATRLFRSILYADERHTPSLERLVGIYRGANQTANALLTLEKLISFSLEDKDTEGARGYMAKLLELDPDNLEWRSRLETLGGGMALPQIQPAAVAPATLTPSSKPKEDATDHSSMVSLDGSVAPSIEPDDPETLIQNHMTEAEVFIKYGIIDQALAHLLEVIEINPRHFEANVRLKHIYADRRENDKVLACLTNMASICMENEDLAQAEELLNEAEELKPGVSRLFRGQLENLRQKERTENGMLEGQEEFNLEFSSPSASEVIEAEAIHQSAQMGGDFHFEEVPAEEVVDLKAYGHGEDVGAEWSLDIPSVSLQPSEPSLELDFSGASQPCLIEQDLSPGLETEISFEAEVAFEDSIEQTDVLADQEMSVGSFDDSSGLYGEKDGVQAFDSGSLEVEEFDHLDLLEIHETAEEDEGDVQILLGKDEFDGPPAEPAPTPPPLPTSREAARAEPAPPVEEIEEIEEIEFFLSMDDVDAARDLLTEAKEKYGPLPVLLEYEERLMPKLPAVPPPLPQGRAGSDSSAQLFEGDGTGFFDLAAELQDEIFDEEISEVTDNQAQEEIQSVEELFEEFKRGVAEQIDEEDYETHYDLGIAYKEMGLVEEAIVEFEKALGDHKRFMECTAMIGSCLIELGRAEEAVSRYDEALAHSALEAQEKLALSYECALACEGLGDLDRALALFRSIQAANPRYRDVESRIASLV